ncbi:MAG TPA: carbohydrate porin [Thermoanaerobaculia bacterium]|nr:carbohydrate porin [Thermoanaerobaculia bacterium]
MTVTLYGGARLWKGAWLCVQPEFATGNGVGGGAGAAAYPNVEIVRVASIIGKPYIARAFLQQVLSFGSPADGDAAPADGNPEEKFSPGGGRPLGGPAMGLRLVFTFGKISLPDVFDTNDFIGDGRHGLGNWALANNGAWDYAADTRGYTWGFTVAWEGGPMAARVGAYAMPSKPNGPNYDHDLARAHGINGEIEWVFDPAHEGVARLTAYQNRARMGSYDEALALANGGVPDLAPTREPGREKWGLGFNSQRRFSDAWGVSLRLGWNDGKNETFAYTEIDRTISLGVSHPADFWGRPKDRVYLAAVVSGLSGAHRRYLAAGGSGFQLGDGKLNYSPEVAAELDYLAIVTRAVGVSLDVQYLSHPGFNADRGPIAVFGLRLHIHR